VSTRQKWEKSEGEYFAEKRKIWKNLRGDIPPHPRARGGPVGGCLPGIATTDQSSSRGIIPPCTSKRAASQSSN